MNKKIISILTITVLLLTTAVPEEVRSQDRMSDMTKGVWVSVFSERKVLFKKTAVNELLDFCENNGIRHIYLQIYRAGQAFYDSDLCDRTKYDLMLKESGGDMIEYLLGRAASKDIKVFAWVNLLNLAQNDKAAVVQKYGRGIITVDQYGGNSLVPRGGKTGDKAFLKEKMLFLEPGDQRVVNYTVSIISEIVNKYPQFDGIHLDYIRYPYAVPFIPNSEFSKFGLSYGFTRANTDNFRSKTGYDANALEGAAIIAWDNWKRDRVTNLVTKIRETLNKKPRRYLLSAAVIPSFERAYTVGFQDWPLWLEKGFIDYVVLMSYTRDERYFYEVVKAAGAFADKNKIFAGIGVFLIRNDPQFVINEIKALDKGIGAGGIVYFSYDDIFKRKNIIQIGGSE